MNGIDRRHITDMRAMGQESLWPSATVSDTFSNFATIKISALMQAMKA